MNRRVFARWLGVILLAILILILVVVFGIGDFVGKLVARIPWWGALLAGVVLFLFVRRFFRRRMW